jgi:hypothetical protein
VTESFTLIAGIVGLKTKDAVHRFKGPFLLMVVYTVVILIFFPQLRYLTLVKFFSMPFAGLGFLNVIGLKPWSVADRPPLNSQTQSDS